MNLLDKFGEANPESIVLGLARVQARIMRSNFSEAKKLAAKIFTTSVDEVMANAAQVAVSILNQ